MPDSASRPVSDTAAEERPSWACQLHAVPAPSQSWMKADPGYVTCSGCLDRLRATLRTIATTYYLLDARPGSSGDSQGRGSPGFRSTPAANLNVVVMRDPRSIPYETPHDAVQYVWDSDAEDGGGAYVERREVWFGADGRGHTEQAHAMLSIPGTLAGIARGIASMRDLAPPQGGVGDLARWLDGHLDWLTRQDWVSQSAREIHRLAAQIRGTQEPRRKIGHCPNTIDQGDTTRPCAAPLYAPVRGDTISCATCSRRWGRADWLRLGRLLHDAA